ncbi:MAG: hypothetical protein LBH88_01810, partial [Candidatus Methanoplasma sp.]|nr:hypothetical protein [Candidatus Methanoplasma sp.]
IEYIGQNAEEYFVLFDMKITSSMMPSSLPIELSAYVVEYKGLQQDAKKVSTSQNNTFEGTKTLERWDYGSTDLPWAFDGTKITIKAYIDPSNGLRYELDVPLSGYSLKLRLEKYELKWQDSYEESDAVGTALGYTVKTGGRTYDRNMVCVADCVDGKYGVVYNLTGLGDESFGMLYFLCDTPWGLPADAVRTGTAAIDGTPVEKWTADILGMVDMSFYYDPVSGKVHRFLADEYGTPITGNLKG